MMIVQTPDRILVIKLRYVGDVLLATPVLSRLRESFPKAHLAMLVNPGTDDVVRDHSALDEVLVLERGNLARQKRARRTEHHDDGRVAGNFLAEPLREPQVLHRVALLRQHLAQLAGTPVGENHPDQSNI